MSEGFRIQVCVSCSPEQLNLEGADRFLGIVTVLKLPLMKLRLALAIIVLSTYHLIGDLKEPIISLCRTCAVIAFLKLSLSEVHFNTGRLLFEFNGLQYSLAAGEVFVTFANPVSLTIANPVSLL